ncbi:hypothetical protein PTSG_10075 [Salpingoeca rosetta]|uniref:Ribosomal protein L18 n=1 Tax=Salpingoeca rosetta (strain ATCC 50818 / BSB-021) TaxID=946362 RepID=F2UPE9_SALR5|nr:uncharacterized protein PTSG_10075 [Salpingoeca rosetta]EGD79504.1 hypothetical protein PTSG_10075 [Salpingoeca rosetta]|eukprot:XP_004988985.1 hypothetical protein PTSG_10075 [Salpingoeca rosetta]
MSGKLCGGVVARLAKVPVSGVRAGAGVVQQTSALAQHGNCKRHTSSSSSSSTPTTPASSKYQQQTSTCGTFTLTNRNPRSAELLRQKHKPRGFGTSVQSFEFYHRLRFQKSNKHLTTTLETPGNQVWLTASTKEYNIQRHLYSYNSVTTARELAKIMARRLKESGIERVTWHTGKDGYRGKASAFIDSLRAQGITTKE